VNKCGHLEIRDESERIILGRLVGMGYNVNWIELVQCRIQCLCFCTSGAEHCVHVVGFFMTLP
jgi:hypothetical protein